MIGLATILVAAAVGTNDPVAECRAAHDVQSAAYVTCLEDALRRLASARTSAATSSTAAGGAGGAAGAVDGASAGPAAAIPAPRRELGADQVEQERRNRGQSDEQPVPVQIVGVDYRGTQLATLTLADGQVWRETSITPRAQRLAPGKAYRGRIERGAVGGYRLYVEGIKFMYTVRRLR